MRWNNSIIKKTDQISDWNFPFISYTIPIKLKEKEVSQFRSFEPLRCGCRKSGLYRDLYHSGWEAYNWPRWNSLQIWTSVNIPIFFWRAIWEPPIGKVLKLGGDVIILSTSRMSEWSKLRILSITLTSIDLSFWRDFWAYALSMDNISTTPIVLH